MRYGIASQLWAPNFQLLFHNHTSRFSPAIVSTRSCRMLERTVDIVYSSTVALTTLLFFFRTRAVFDQNRWIIAFFAGLWLTVSVGCLAFIIYALVSSHPECIDKRANPFIALTTITPLINDTLVFLAITWRLFRNSYARPTLKSGFRFLVFGDYLPAFSRALLRDGQAYYLFVPFSDLCLVIKWLVCCSFFSIGPSLPWISSRWSCYSIIPSLPFFNRFSGFPTSHWRILWPAEYSGTQNYQIRRKYRPSLHSPLLEAEQVIGYDIAEKSMFNISVFIFKLMVNYVGS